MKIMVDIFYRSSFEIGQPLVESAPDSTGG
jgi:hypothetical protein